MNIFSKSKSFNFITEAKISESNTYMINISNDKSSKEIIGIFDELTKLKLSWTRALDEQENIHRLTINTQLSQEELRTKFEQSDYLSGIVIIDMNKATEEKINFDTFKYLNIHENNPSDLLEKWIQEAFTDLQHRLSKIETQMKSAVDADSIESIIKLKDKTDKHLKEIALYNQKLKEIESLIKTNKLKNAQKLSTIVINLEKKVDDHINKITKNLDGLRKMFSDYGKEIEKTIDTLATKEDVEKISATLGMLMNRIEKLDRENLIPEEDTKRIKQKGRTIQTNKKISDENLEEEKTEAELGNILIKIEKFKTEEQKTVEEVSKIYLPLKSELEPLSKVSKVEFDKINSYLDEIAKTKIAILKGIKDKIKEPTTEDEKLKPKPEEDSFLTSKSSLRGNRYVHTIYLSLGRKITLDATKFKVEKVGGPTETDELMDSVFAKIGKIFTGAVAYEPEPGVEALIQYYQDQREAVGTLTQWISKNTLGLLTGVMSGTAGIVKGDVKGGFKKGMEFGEEVGKYIKGEIVGKPGELNPTILDLENYIRGKLNIEKYLEVKKSENHIIKSVTKRQDPYFKTTTDPYTGVKRRHPIEIERSEQLKKATREKKRKIKENAEGGPVGPSGTPQGGTGFQTGAMLTGMGDPVAPTETTLGSGDIFQTVKKKKKKKKKKFNENIMNFSEFVRRINK